MAAPDAALKITTARPTPTLPRRPQAGHCHAPTMQLPWWKPIRPTQESHRRLVRAMALYSEKILRWRNLAAEVPIAVIERNNCWERVPPVRL
jgi:hypothetical protein